MSRSAADRALVLVLGASALVSGGFVVLIVGFVAQGASAALWDVGLARFFADDTWRPTGGEQAGYGVVPMLVASVLVTAGALALAGPLGVLTALFTSFQGPRWLAVTARRVLELLNGVPSVLFGLWGLTVVAPLIDRWRPPGQSLLAGILVLALMIVPTVALYADAAFRALPPELFRSAAALGLGRVTTLVRLVLPAARPGIVSGLALGAARAIGETMAVVMVCGNIVRLPHSVFDPVRTVTANIALEMGYATAEHRSALFVTGLVLMALIAALILAGRAVTGSAERVRAEAVPARSRARA